MTCLTSHSNIDTKTNNVSIRPKNQLTESYSFRSKLCSFVFLSEPNLIQNWIY